MTDMLKSIARKASAERQFQFETNSAREMAKHCDRRIAKAKKALALIAARAVADERERCAQIADDCAETGDDNGGEIYIAKLIAKKIRT